MAWFLTLLAWLLAAVVLAPACFFMTMLVAGPHSSLLPSFLQPIALLLGWLLFLVGPVWVARVVWVRVTRSRSRG